MYRSKVSDLRGEAILIGDSHHVAAGLEADEGVLAVDKS